MALSFANKAKANSAPAQNPTQSGASAQSDTVTKDPTAASFAGAKKSSIGSFMKRGKAADNAVKEADARADAARAEAGKMRRFWLKKDEERLITFLDGELDDDGILSFPVFDEHSVKINGEWHDYVCTADKDGYCPICSQGEYKQALVAAGTVLNNTKYTVQSGQNAGKVYQHQRQLFIPKKETLKQLQKIAVKRGGLTGCQFEVTRIGDKAARVGSHFEFVKKFESYASIAAAFNLKAEDVQPADYAEEITYRTPDELLKLGIGKAPNGPGYEKPIDQQALSDAM